MKTRVNILRAALAIILMIGLTNTSSAQKSKKEYKAEVETLKTALEEIAKSNALVEDHLKKFDELDFEVLPTKSGQDYTKVMPTIF